MGTRIDSKTMDFLRQLKVNNDRVWFNERKELFQEAMGDFSGFVGHLISRLTDLDKSLIHLEPQDCVFRIYKDTRFSKDKTPYKTHFGAYIVAGGRKSPRAGYYFHLEPGGTMAAGGIHAPEPDNLKILRESISRRAGDFRSIVESPGFKRHFREFWGERLKTAPKGFDKEDPMVEFLKFKEFTVAESLSDEEALSDGLADRLMEAFRAMRPVNDFFNQSLGY